MVVIAFGVFIAMNISRMLTTVIGEAARLSDDAVNGKLQTRGNPDLVSKEFRPILTGFNATLDAVVGPLNVTANTWTASRRATFPRRSPTTTTATSTKSRTTSISASTPSTA